MSKETTLRRVGRVTGVPAGAAGAGSGTLLALLAGHLADSNPWKPWLVLVAPSVSVAVAVLTARMKPSVEQWLNGLELRFKVSGIVRAKRRLESLLDNPVTSNEHKRELREQFEVLEKEAVRVQIEGIKVQFGLSTPRRRLEGGGKPDRMKSLP